jgi:tRNA (cytidine32/guanosine34-2'-O)-methyltransferase
MAPLPGITQLQADITHPATVPLLLKALDPDSTPSHLSSTNHRVDLVISDGAPDVTGLHSLDIYIQASLLYSALSLALKVLRPGGKFVAKIFRGKNVDLIYAQLKCVFERVTVAKPRSSRASSIEAFVVCEGYIPLEAADGDGDVDVRERLEKMTVGMAGSAEVEGRGWKQKAGQTRTTRADGVVELTFDDNEPASPAERIPRSKRWIPPFLACGDLSAWDSDATYRLPEGHVSLAPVQPPTAPPYKEAIERRRVNGGMYGKTKHQDRSKAKEKAVDPP